MKFTLVEGLSQSQKDLEKLSNILVKKFPDLQISDVIDSKYGMVRVQLTYNKHKQNLFWVGHNEYALGDRYNSYTGDTKDIVKYLETNFNKLFNVKVECLHEATNSNILNYSKGQQYSATYIDSKGDTYNEVFTPDQDMNIVQVISYLKNNFDNFFKLISIIEYIPESVDKYKELRKILNEDDSTTDDYELPNDRQQFEQFVKDTTAKWTVSEFIKLFRTSKQNSHNEWGTYIYCYDYLDENGNFVNGYNTYIPYDSSSKFVTNLIAQEMDIIDDIYAQQEDIVVQK